MTTDEGTKPEGEVQVAALAERGEDITPARDRGVLKVSGVPRPLKPSGHLVARGDERRCRGE